MGLSSEKNQRLSDLMKQAQDGDSLAYAELLAEVSQILKSFLIKRTGTAMAADDIIQETLLAIHGARHTYRPEKPFAPWMFAISQHKLGDYWRRLNRSTQREVQNELVLQNYSYAETQNNGFDDRLTQALAELPEKQRRAVDLTKIQGYSVEEAAQKMNIGVSALKVLAHRAYKALRLKLGRRDDGNK